MAAAARRGQRKQSLRRVDDPRHVFRNDPLLELWPTRKEPRKDVQQHVHLPDATAAAEAAELIAQFGDHAAFEAAARANHSRGLGNVVHFCRWRQIERMINLLTAEDPGEITVH
jgi:hypothetical protein